MRIYGDGLLIHQSQSDEGIIEVVDTGECRSLHFGTFPRQSSMCLRKPYQLELTYTQAMMACLILHPQPKKALVIGLGGGSLVKFLLHHFPDCMIDVVEYREDVIQVAKQFFSVPDNDPRLEIKLGDGYRHVTEQFYAGDEHYDLILVDAYDHTGMDESVGFQAFFDACSGLLTSTGVLSMNLWGSERAQFNQTMERINDSFGHRTMIVPVENKGNVIALASHQVMTHSELKKMRPVVEAWEMKLQANLPRSLQTLIGQNRSFISRLFA